MFKLVDVIMAETQSSAAVTFLADIEVERRPACRRVAADKAAGGNAVFITLQEGEIRRCLAVDLLASADLRRMGLFKEKECLCCYGPASAFCLTSTALSLSLYTNPTEVFFY